MAFPQSQASLDRKDRFVLNLLSQNPPFHLLLLRVLFPLFGLNPCTSFLNLTFHRTCLQTAREYSLSIQTTQVILFFWATADWKCAESKLLAWELRLLCSFSFSANLGVNLFSKFYASQPSLILSYFPTLKKKTLTVERHILGKKCCILFYLKGRKTKGFFFPHMHI